MGGKIDFVGQLKEIYFEVQERDGNKVVFDYIIPCGRFKDQKIILGFEVPPDFPLSPPSGPHISPRILPLNPNASTHPERVAESSPFGQEWEYWSRPFKEWPKTKRTVKDYMSHIRHLFDTQ